VGEVQAGAHPVDVVHRLRVALRAYSHRAIRGHGLDMAVDEQIDGPVNARPTRGQGGAGLGDHG
jgi:hypothetical protein